MNTKNQTMKLYVAYISFLFFLFLIKFFKPFFYLKNYFNKDFILYHTEYLYDIMKILQILVHM